MSDPIYVPNISIEKYFAYRNKGKDLSSAVLGNMMIALDEDDRRFEYSEIISPSRDDQLNKIVNMANWCVQHVELVDWGYRCVNFWYFKNIEDATQFKLTWC